MKPTDPIGFATLRAFEGAHNFNAWLFESIAPYCTGAVLEIGSGIGNISKLLLRTGQPVTLSDIKPEYCAVLINQFKDCGNLTGVFPVDLSKADFEDVHGNLIGQFDSVIALNVVEHIQEDALAIRNCGKLLKKDGRLILLVPAFPCLYNSLDRELGHFVRYDKAMLGELLNGEGMRILKMQFFNSPAIPGWWTAGSLLKRKRVAVKQIKVFDRFVPFFRWIDRLLGKVVGISIVTVAVKI